MTNPQKILDKLQGVQIRKPEETGPEPKREDESPLGRLVEQMRSLVEEAPIEGWVVNHDRLPSPTLRTYHDMKSNESYGISVGGRKFTLRSICCGFDYSRSVYEASLLFQQGRELIIVGKTAEELFNDVNQRYTSHLKKKRKEAEERERREKLGEETAKKEAEARLDSLLRGITPDKP